MKPANHIKEFMHHNNISLHHQTALAFHTLGLDFISFSKDMQNNRVIDTKGHFNNIQNGIQK